MKRIAKMLVLILMLSFVFEVATPLSMNEVTVAQAATKASVKLNASKKTLTVGKTFQLRLTGTTKKATWSSSNKSVATVSKKGKVTAKAVGTATITAKVGNKKYTCKITVKAGTNSLVKNAPFDAKQVEMGPYTMVVPKDWDCMDFSYTDSTLLCYYPKLDNLEELTHMIMILSVKNDAFSKKLDYNDLMKEKLTEEELLSLFNSSLGLGQTAKDVKLSVITKGKNTYIEMDCVIQEEGDEDMAMNAYFRFEDGYMTLIAPMSYGNDLKQIKDITDYMLTSLTCTK